MAASATYAVGVNGLTLPQATLGVASTAGFAANGSLLVQTVLGFEVVTYTGTTANTFTGCTGGAGVLAQGAAIINLAQTTVGGGGAALPLGGAALTVAANAGFTISGTLLVVSNAGPQPVTYTGQGVNTFTNCNGGTGAVAVGAAVTGLPTTTTIAAASNGVALPTGTITVAATNGFPPAGLLVVMTTSGLQAVSYASTTATTFAGCSGGLGKMATGGLVAMAPWPSGLQTVPNLAVLKSTLPWNGTDGVEQAMVLGAVTPGDGGGGLFFWDPRIPPSYAIGDNIGAVITVGTAGCWRRVGFELLANATGTQLDQVPGALDLRWFGAVGDGTTDNTAAFTAALSALLTQTTTVAAASNAATISKTTNVNGAQVLPPTGGTLTVAAAAGFPSSGVVSVQSTGGVLQNVAYGSWAGTTFSGCSGTQVSTTSAPVSQVLPGSGTFVLHVASTLGFPPSGTLSVLNTLSAMQIITYAGIGSTGAFYGCSGGTGTIAASQVLAAVSIANGQTVESCLNVASTANFAPSGKLTVQTTTGTQTVTYSGLTATAFTGCTGGTGTLSTGTLVAGRSINAGVLKIAGGTYRLASSLSIPPNVTLLFEAGIISVDNGVTLTVNGDVQAPESQIFTYPSSPSAQPVVFGITSAAKASPLWFDGAGFRSTWAIGTFPGKVPTVPSISALRNFPVTIGQAIDVLGFAGPGDGGGGRFVWDATAVQFLDDNVGVVITSNVTTAGRWRRDGFLLYISSASQGVNPVVERVNVKWFGAKGDGATDDTFAIQTACNVALQIAGNLAQIIAYITPPGGFFTSVGVTIPAGVYTVSGVINGNCGIDIGGGLTITGEDGPVIQSASSTISLFRLSSWTTIRGLTFKGGNHQLALYGWNSGMNTIYSPIPSGNVPIRIDGCNFSYPVGPAIWQDIGPATTVASGGTLPLGTITVGSTNGFRSSGQIAIHLQDGTYQAVNYTGTTATTFTGCTAGTGTLHAGDWVVDNSLWRSFWGTLRVDNFHFAGAHLFWGCGDSVMFTNGHIAWDFTNALTSQPDGLPLGLFNSSDLLILDNITAFGGGTALPRQPMLVCCGSVMVHHTAWGQDDELCFIRVKLHGAGYDGGTGVPVELPYGSPAPVTVDLTIDTSELICSFGVFWLECSEAIPTAVRVKNWCDFDFENTQGIWVDQSVNIPTALGNHVARQYVQTDGFMNWGQFSIFQGYDPGTSAAPSRSLAVDVTPMFKLFVLEQDWPGTATSEQNLFNYTASADGSPLGFNFTSGATTTDSTTGYPINLWTASSLSPVAATATMQIPFASLMPNNLQPGIYCFSFYWKSNFAGSFTFSIGPSGTITTQAVRKYEAGGGWQRVWVAFWYPGNGASWSLSFVTTTTPALLSAWAASTPYALSQQVTNGGNVYLCAVAGTSVSGPTGIGSLIHDGPVRWNYVGPGGTFSAACAMGLMMLNQGRNPAPYIFPQNNDANLTVGYVPRVAYGISAPSTGNSVVGDMVYNTVPNPGGCVGWICTTAGSPGVWYPFGTISNTPFYFIPTDVHTMVHVNALDLHNGTANVGPIWTRNGSVPINSGNIASVGPFTSAANFTLGVGNLMSNVPSPFTFAVIYSQTNTTAQNTVLSSNVNGVPTHAGFSHVNNYGNRYGNGTAGTDEVGGAGVTSGLNVVLGGFDGTNFYILQNGTSHTSAAATYAAIATVQACLGYDPNSGPFGGNIVEFMLSSNTPSTAALNALYAAILANGA